MEERTSRKVRTGDRPLEVLGQFFMYLCLGGFFVCLVGFFLMFFGLVWVCGGFFFVLSLFCFVFLTYVYK